MADDVRRLSDELARDPGSRVFVPLGEALRRQGQLDLALKVTLRGLERHPHFADAHDLLARIAVDRGEISSARSTSGTWCCASSPGHLGALKGMGFVCFQQGRFARGGGVSRRGARRSDDGDEQVASALAHVRDARREMAQRPRDPGRLPAGTSHDPRFLFADVLQRGGADGAPARSRRARARGRVRRVGRPRRGAGGRRGAQWRDRRGASRDAPSRARRVDVDRVRDRGGRRGDDAVRAATGCSCWPRRARHRSASCAGCSTSAPSGRAAGREGAL